ncbi:MAG: holo-ACP synthase [Clostridia bacterium]|nr:holo-ACP synthase [Clostridia bacterium]
MRVGNDIVDVKRFLELVSNKRFLDRVFLEDEQQNILSQKDKQKRAERMAGRFSAKEAVAKALGLGISGGVDFLSICILPDEFGAPKVKLSGEALNVFNKLKAKEIELSISNTDSFATAVCVII